MKDFAEFAYLVNAAASQKLLDSIKNPGSPKVLFGNFNGSKQNFAFALLQAQVSA